MPGGSFITGSAMVCELYSVNTTTAFSHQPKKWGREEQRKTCFECGNVQTPHCIPQQISKCEPFKAVLSNKDPICFFVFLFLSVRNLVGLTVITDITEMLYCHRRVRYTHTQSFPLTRQNSLGRASPMKTCPLVKAQMSKTVPFS